MERGPALEAQPVPAGCKAPGPRVVQGPRPQGGGRAGVGGNLPPALLLGSPQGNVPERRASRARLPTRWH